MEKELYKNKYRIDSARLKGWDYRNDGAYFITICTKNRIHYFGEIENGKMQLSDIGKLAHGFWAEIPDHFPFVKLDEFVIMPNHTHGILVIDNGAAVPVSVSVSSVSVETLHCNVSTDTDTDTDTDTPNQKMKNISPKPGSISTIIRSFKSVTTKHARKIQPDFAWQTRFHDHIIRDKKSHANIRRYIKNNPQQWTDDKFYQ